MWAVARFSSFVVQTDDRSFDDKNRIYIYIYIIYIYIYMSDIYMSVFQLGWEKGGCKRNWAQSSTRTTKIRAQFSAQTTQNLLRVNDQNLVLWAIDENMGTNLQAFYKHFYISCLKTQKQRLHFVKIIFFFFFNSGRARVNRAGRKPVLAGRSALRNRLSWNTVIVWA